MALKIRKHPRLKGYDYNCAGVYFLTLCAKGYKHIFSRISESENQEQIIEPTEYGGHIKKTIEYINENSADVKIESYVIMPNHVHLLVSIKNEQTSVIPRRAGASGMPRPTGATTTGAPPPTNMVIPKMVSSLKRYTNKQSGNDLWQDCYYDHIIRNEQDYLTHLKYIEENPARWASDEIYKSK